MAEITLAHSEITNKIYALIGKEKVDITEQAIAEVKALKALEQEQEPCEDCISRKAVFDLMRSLTRWCVRSYPGNFTNVGLLYDDVMFGIDKIPSVNPQEPKTDIDKIRAEIEKAVWEDVVVSLDGTDEVRILRLEPDDVFEIIDKYREEQGHYEKLTEHYNSKKDEIKPNPELWSIQDATDILIKHGLMKRVSETDVLDRIRAEIEEKAERYCLSRESGYMGQVEWSERLIKESDVLQIIDKYRSAE